MGSTEEADSSPDDSSNSANRQLLKGIVQATVVAVILWFVVSLFYPPFIGLMGAEPGESDVPSVLAVQLIAASYPFFSLAVDQVLQRYYGYGNQGGDDDGDFYTVLESLPSNAIGQLEDESQRDSRVDEELTEEYDGRSIPNTHPAWTVSLVTRENVHSPTPRRCIHTRKEILQGEEHLLVQATYNPPQFDPQHIWFRFVNEEALSEWFGNKEDSTGQ